ncbi:M48 family metallopeptidase [Flavimarina sp. Hel_I_48]|uniref:M48 family metallopeptidase n=1 Tax=Flavimarina sp. Hel_I_48 TaxID=1392488 RepID=UPI0004DF5793|nr:SprT family zinc-dependent metalloprotease [Flavimarina sp. Hel_I_48]
MTTSKDKLAIANIEIDIIRKNIKNMHLAVYPPTGRIRLSAPVKTDDEVLRLFAISKLSWIKKHVENFKSQPRESEREFITGESHYVKGKRYLLKVVSQTGPSNVSLNGTKELLLKVKPDASRAEKSKILKEWYRKNLKSEIPELLAKWEERIGVKSKDWGVKQMRTKWGACNIEEKRIWLNLELGKKPTICLEYIIVHELTHLLERNHNERFIQYMDIFMPKWRLHREALNNLPVAHNDWAY